MPQNNTQNDHLLPPPSSSSSPHNDLFFDDNAQTAPSGPPCPAIDPVWELHGHWCTIGPLAIQAGIHMLSDDFSGCINLPTTGATAPRVALKAVSYTEPSREGRELYGRKGSNMGYMDH